MTTHRERELVPQDIMAEFHSSSTLRTQSTSQTKASQIGRFASTKATPTHMGETNPQSGPFSEAGSESDEVG